MATITQTIPNLYQGISQQPDEQKLPGQVRNAENIVPDIIDGLTKRPGLEFVKTLSNVAADGCWFEYFRDDNEGAYIGQVDRTGTVRAWRCNDGVEMKSNTTNLAPVGQANYLIHASDGDIQALTINDTTFLSNKVSTVAMTTAVAPSKPDLYSAYIELKQLAPRREYALNIFDPTNNTYITRLAARTVTIDGPFTDNVDTNSDSRYTGTKVHVDQTTGIAVRVTITGQPFIYQYDSDNRALYKTQYTNRVDLLYGGSYTSSSPTFTVSVEGANYTISVTDEQTGSFKGDINLVRPIPTDLEAETSSSVAAVLASIKEEITGITATIIGSGLYLTHTSAFNVEALENDLFNILTDEINDLANLPKQCKNNYIVKVTNSAQVQEDDIYLKFIGDNNTDGSGYWSECAGPGVETTIDPATMPYILQRTDSTKMSLGQYTWSQREVGDETTNAKPTFIGKKISKVLFHRNRLVLLSGSNIILSQPGDLSNFWNRTALTFSGVDRIDISCSSSSPNELVNGVEMNTGLVVFSGNAQYLLSTDSDVLNPETAKVYSISTYNFNINVDPISLGTSLAFIDNAGKYSRFFELVNITREQQPEILEPSKVVHRLLSKDINSLANSRENSFVFACKLGTNTVTGFKYYNAEKRLQGAWFTWNFAKNISHQFIINDEYYIVSSENELCKVQLIDTTSRPFITQGGTDFDVHLDYYQAIANSSLSYNATTNITTLTLPSDTPLNNGDNVAVIVTESNNNRGRYEKSTVNNGAVSLTNDWSSDPVKVGQEYEMKVELPTIYPTTVKNNRIVSDTRSSLVLQRIKLNFGPVGQFVTKLERTGKPDFTDIHESSLLDGYLANRAPNIEGGLRTIPVYERNTNVSVTITSTHPSPATIESMSWEGDYNTRYYNQI